MLESYHDNTNELTLWMNLFIRYIDFQSNTFVQAAQVSYQ
ncbi:hypothetical protein GXM_02955 [Nostoc sphaeroides CCNUC1]|uniref:Uncharacterized protein n=1 Tax=Nostoc sphaeroides CCNUC1 TaxID=2653204 RepID=A0A5P8VYH5_9NOSO|nr:hypothetical protein GXM_02955 [Nostoc sphaeroides CCNUC1]